MAGENVGAIYYTVEADTAKLLDSVIPADKSLDGLNKTFAKTDKAASQAGFQMTKTAQAVRGLGDESKGAASQVSALTKVFGGLLTLQGAKGLIDMADAYNEMAERITMATSSAEEYEHVQQRLLATANGTYRSLAEAQELYVLTASTLRGLGYDTDRSMDIVDSLSYSFVKNATAADRAQSTINAVTKSLNKGKVDAEAWMTILAATPTIVGDLATSMDLATAEILRMGASGEITGRQLSESLLGSLEANKKASDDMATTVQDAFNNMRNNLSVFIGEANRSTGATQLMSSALVGLGDNIDTVVKLLMVASANVMARYISQLGASTLASMRAMMAARAHAAEELKLAQAQVAATAASVAQFQGTTRLAGAHGTAAQAAIAHSAALTRLQVAQTAVIGVGRTLISVLGGPVGIIALAASAGAAFLTMGGSAQDAKPKIDLLTKSLNDLGDAQLRVLRTGLIDKITEMDSLAGVSAKAGARIEYLNRQLAMHPSSKQAAGWRREIDEQAASIEEASKKLGQYREQQRLVETEQNKRTDGAPMATRDADPDVAKRLQGMRDELELAKLTGEARARLQAIQKLGANATAEERAEAERLAAEIYILEDARSKLKDTTKAGAKAENENAKAIKALEDELTLAALSGEALAEAKALSKLNEFASPDEVARVRELAAAIHEVQEAERLRSELAKIDSTEGEVQRFEKEMESLEALNEAKLLENERYLGLKGQMEEEHAEKMAALKEEEFRKQSEWNEILMGTLDNLEAATTSAITGLVTGATTGTQALQALGQAILNDVVSSFVKMGIEQVKAIVMGRAAQSAAGAAYAGATAAQVKATTALAAQAAFASTAAIPIVGPSLAPAAAAAAAGAAAGLGAPAVVASMAAGARYYGGPVDPTKMYRVNEGGKPEILNMANGQQFLLPNQRGEVVSNRDAEGKGGAGKSVVVTNTIHLTVATTWPPSDKDIRELGERLNDAIADGMKLIT